ncbi:hypothetical protein CTheo_3603 [Ceratobasidium theobromae]|uniref:CFEM domain-containing protein n=1 Tax=Ceratobasidium theobromae TaxID=1582974 RepID=A0A5N5QN12_9AGAM|nr:hypothetical protein CTheo_3603 [Ceratobasidium theobromae]
MRVSIVLAALATVASASGYLGKRQIPDCALKCMTSASTGSCSPTDNTCLCKSEAFVDTIYNCFYASCSASEFETATAAARALCSAAGVTLTSTPVITATATAPASSHSATATASASATSSSSNGAAAFGASPMIGAVAALAGVVFAL